MGFICDTMTMFIVYVAIHPDGSRYYGLTSKGIAYAKHQHRLSSYGSGGHTSVTGLSLYASKTNTPMNEWEFKELVKLYGKKTALQYKRAMVENDEDCLNIKYKNSYRRI